MNLFRSFLLIPLISTPLAWGQRKLYVNATAIGAYDGTSWENAYSDLQDALNDSRDAGNCPCEIWVAAGTYKPDRGTGDRFASFHLLNGVSLYGGFAGWESCLGERNSKNNVTILDGDLLENDASEPNSGSTCCAGDGVSECDDEACRQAVCALGPGIAHCCTGEWRSFCRALASEICCDLCRPSRCDNSNHVLNASGVDSSALLDGFTVRNGEANTLNENFDDWGGGILGLGTYRGPESADPTVQNCLFTNNAAAAGSAFVIYWGSPTIKNCIFAENESFGGGTVGVNTRGYVAMTDCIFDHNKRGALGVAGSFTEGNADIANCQFMGTQGGTVVGVGNIACNMRDCLFAGNEIDGEILSAWYATLHVSNCIFISNEAAWGLSTNASSAAALTNCLFASNKLVAPTIGVGLSCAVSLSNSTIAYNHTTSSIAGIYTDGALTIKNSIIWGNEAELPSAEQLDEQLVLDDEGSLSLSYTTIQDWDGSFGGVEINGVDPLFADANGPDNIPGTLDDDFRLSSASQLINAGNPNISSTNYADLDGHARVLFGRVDRGAYEFGIGDFNHDSTIDLADARYFWACLTGPIPDQQLGDCVLFDFHAELIAHIDLLDFAGLQNAFDIP